MSDALGHGETAVVPSTQLVPPPDEPGARQQHSTLDRLVFKRDLNEVHLLLDFLSGNADKSLEDLTLPNPANPSHTLNSGDVVRYIARLRYPPSNDDVVKADNASFLLLVKDRLSRLASPVRGTTIAYTTMFAEGARPLLGLLLDRIDPWGRRGQRPRRGDDSRLSLAIETFPGLRQHAVYFRRTFSCLPLAALLWLILTVLTYWQVALGQSVLHRLEQFYKDRVALVQDNSDLLVPGLCPAYHDGDELFPGVQGTLEAIKIAASCRHLWSLDKSRYEALLDLDRTVNCNVIWPNLVSAALGWNRVLCDRPLRPSGGGTAGPTQAHPEFAESRVDWQSATSVLSVLSTYVLPMMFAILGTLIAIMRNVHIKVRDSELAPRDRMLMLLGLPMGAIAGVAVGLFFNPSGAPVPGASVPSGNLSLTASGLGFLAGYGAEAFFRFLDSLLRMVFPDRGSAASSARSPAVATLQPSPSALPPPAAPQPVSAAHAA